MAIQRQTVSLEAEGGAVMLSLSDGESHVFRQALDAHDVGSVLAAARGIPQVGERAVCQGDLVVRPEFDRQLTLRWQQDGGTGSVLLSYPDNLVFQEALKSYCRLLMRSQEGLP
jgi:hypothetical protein